MLVLMIFAVTYIGVAIGRIPGLVIDRTGIALLGAIAMVVSGAISLDRAAAAIDVPTILLLFALMILSAQLRLGGFYTRVATAITNCSVGPRLLLFNTMLVSAVLSALLANDIVCLAFTPVLAVSLTNARLNPLPFLIGLAVSSNIGSAATIIGNPQNMLIGQVGQLDFGRFFLWCAPPSLLALLGSHLIICRCYRNRFQCQQVTDSLEGIWPTFNTWQTLKGLAAVIILVLLFFTLIPREISAIAVAGILLCSRRMKSRQIVELVDWYLLALFFALFVVMQSFTDAGLPAAALRSLQSLGIDLHNLYVLSVVTTFMSNMFSNVPAVMLLTRFLDPNNPFQWQILAISSTFAGNLITIGSIANLIVIEQARNFGIDITFKEHARIGIPVTLFSLLVLAGWIAL
ncbi:MAG TPA: anion transporter [Desulfobacterales bacterium]